MELYGSKSLLTSFKWNFKKKKISKLLTEPGPKIAKLLRALLPGSWTLCSALQNGMLLYKREFCKTAFQAGEKLVIEYISLFKLDSEPFPK